MPQRILSILLACIIAIAGLAACGAPAATDVAVETSQSTSLTTAISTEDSAVAGVPTTGVAPSTAETLLAENSAPDMPALIVSENATVVTIALAGDTITVAGDGVAVDGAIAMITAPGVYQISGTLNDGQIVVDAANDAQIAIILNGATIASSTSAPLYVNQAASVDIVLADGTENRLTDGASYVYRDADTDEPNAALFSDVDLRISGAGALTVDANYNDGIASKDGLVIDGGTIQITAADDGLRGKDELIVLNGDITIAAGGDGLKADNDSDPSKGYVAIDGGALLITAGGDGISAETDLAASGGQVTIVSGGGSAAMIGADASAKGLKAGVNLTIDDGDFTIDSADDALHSNGELMINGGIFALAAGDDGFHAETTLTVNGGEIAISRSYEGIEGAAIALNAGSISIVASDDGVNAAGGDGSAAGGMPNPGGPQGGAGGSFTLTINGGTLLVDAGGDGLDANGAIVMTGGLVIVNGPIQRMNGALDSDGGFQLRGGAVVAVGSAGMAEAPNETSSQPSLLLNLSAAQAAGTLIHIEDSAGANVLTFAPSKQYQSLAFSSAALQTGETYTVYLGGSATGDAVAGLYDSPDYSPGAAYTSFTVESMVTRIGVQDRGGFR